MTSTWASRRRRAYRSTRAPYVAAPLRLYDAMLRDADVTTGAVRSELKVVGTLRSSLTPGRLSWRAVRVEPTYAGRVSTRRAASPPDKVCRTCGRPFSWRKKWERDWDQVLYCSKACRAGRTAPDFTPR